MHCTTAAELRIVRLERTIGHADKWAAMAYQEVSKRTNSKGHAMMVGQRLVLIATIVASSTLAYGQQPPDVVVSDANASTAMGSGALLSSMGGDFNTAAGYRALWLNTHGIDNTAIGADALVANTDGSGNTASGFGALWENTIGNNNTASGTSALFSNTTGNDNTACGFAALQGSNGDDNAAVGYFSMYSNTDGNYNTASGYETLYSNTTGSGNTADGIGALYTNTTGSFNVGIGWAALHSNTTGQNNIALGHSAGYGVTSGSNNIDIANAGASTDTATIRIGTPGTHLFTYVAGITGNRVTGAAVYVTSTGALGVLASSERYKTAIAPMGPSSGGLKKLRPVTFHLKTDPAGGTQYGLIAEEVAKVYPELVVRDDRGQIQGVRYEELTPMLLNELQTQAALLSDMRKQVEELQAFKRSMEAH